MRLTLIYNPHAGRGRARREIAKAVRYLEAKGAEVVLIESESPGHLTRAAQEESAQGNSDVVVVCGGDGTINLALREFDLSRGALGILPLGSGDDFARTLGIPRSTLRACDTLLGNRRRAVDVGIVNGVRFLGVAGIGFDSMVARHANSVRLLRGSLVYLFSIFRVLPKFRPLPIRISGDGVQREDELMFVVIANTSQYGGGIRIAPQAEPDDGLFDLYLIHRSSRLELLRTLPAAYRGAHATSRFVENIRGRQFVISAETPLEIFGDGEPLGFTPATFTFCSERLQVVVP